MSKHNYSQYANNKKNNPNKTEPIVTNEVPTIEHEVKPEVETAVVETVITPEVKMEPRPAVTGVVSGCVKLNVRSKPSTDAEVVSVLSGSSEVKVDIANSNREWVKIRTAAGIEGYCMKKFVDIRR